MQIKYTFPSTKT